MKVEGQAPPKRRSSEELDRDVVFIDLIGGAIDDAAEESGWAHLGEVGNIITKKSPDFDSRNYGYAKLSDLLAASAKFEVNRQDKGIRVKRRLGSVAAAKDPAG